MTPLGQLILVLIIATPIAWFLSEFQDRRWLRLALGSVAILMCFGVAFVAASLQRLSYNDWYGSASKKLIDTTITELEAGNKERVLQSFKVLQKKFSPTYENRAHYDELIDEFAAQVQLAQTKAP